MAVLTDEGMMHAARVIEHSVELMGRMQFTMTEYDLRRFEEAVQKFHDAVERLILDGPNPHD